MRISLESPRASCNCTNWTNCAPCTSTDANHCASKETGVSTAQKLSVEKVLATVNGQPADASYQAQPGDALGYVITVSTSGSCQPVACALPEI